MIHSLNSSEKQDRMIQTHGPFAWLLKASASLYLWRDKLPYSDVVKYVDGFICVACLILRRTKIISKHS